MISTIVLSNSVYTCELHHVFHVSFIKVMHYFLQLREETNCSKHEDEDLQLSVLLVLSRDTTSWTLKVPLKLCW